MEGITKSQGLQHITEKVFKILGAKDLQSCRLVNQNFKRIMDEPRFWIEKLAQIPVIPRAPSLWCNRCQVVYFDLLIVFGMLYHSRSDGSNLRSIEAVPYWRRVSIDLKF